MGSPPLLSLSLSLLLVLTHPEACLLINYLLSLSCIVSNVDVRDVDVMRFLITKSSFSNKVNSFFFLSRRSSIQCTSTSRGFIWYVPVIFFSFPTQHFGRTYSRRRSSSASRPTRTRRSLSSRSITTHSPKDFGTPEPEGLRKSKFNINHFPTLKNK